MKFPADLAIFTEEILSGKLHFLCSVINFTDSSYQGFCHHFGEAAFYRCSLARKHTTKNFTKNSLKQNL